MALQETGRAEFKGGYSGPIHEMTEARDTRMGMLALSNQPAHHIPFMYAYASRPGSRAHAKTQVIVREAVERLFVGADLGQGYPGDEDNGEMSAWYLLAASGLYPLSIASGRFVICAPSFRRMAWTLENGKTLEIVAPEASRENRYIQRVWINDLNRGTRSRSNGPASRRGRRSASSWDRNRRTGRRAVFPRRSRRSVRSRHIRRI